MTVKKSKWNRKKKAILFPKVHPSNLEKTKLKGRKEMKQWERAKEEAENLLTPKWRWIWWTGWRSRLARSHTWHRRSSERRQWIFRTQDNSKQVKVGCKNFSKGTHHCFRCTWRTRHRCRNSKKKWETRFWTWQLTKLINIDENC